MLLKTNASSTLALAASSLALCLLISCNPKVQAPKANPKPSNKQSISTKANTSNIEVIMKTNEEWKELLSPKAYHILREHGTERPFGSDYKAFKELSGGSFHCAGCNLLLFDANTRFDSRSGWPSFWQPAQDENVITIEDTTLGMKRVEVRCARCDGHLGHVFEGEGFGTPTDLRYCINAGALEHVPQAKQNK